MLGTWTPDTTPNEPFNAETLNEFTTHMPADITQSDAPALGDWLTQTWQQTAGAWITHEEHQWRELFAHLSVDALLKLAFFYVQAEMQLTGFESGDKNPAIWVFRHLKAHKQLPEKAIIRMLKQCTDNRFIPYGSVL